MKENENALSYIEKSIKELNINFNVSNSYQPFTYFVTVLLNDTQHTIKLPRSLIDDFEVALEKYIDTPYFGTLESAIKFNIYIALGSAGFLPDFEVSHEIINENREWIKKYAVDVFFNDKITKILLEGLKYLNRFFDSLLEKYPSLDLNEVKEHKEWIEDLLQYYNKEKTLNSPGVEIKNLQYLKSAALTQIIDLEEKRREEKKPIIKTALSKEIYYIVSELRKDPFLAIKLPDFVIDLIAG